MIEVSTKLTVDLCLSLNLLSQIGGQNLLREENSHSKESVLKFMKDVLPWMEKQNWIAVLGFLWN